MNPVTSPNLLQFSFIVTVVGILSLVIGICPHPVLAGGKVSLLGLEVGVSDLKVCQCHYQLNSSPGLP